MTATHVLSCAVEECTLGSAHTGACVLRGTVPRPTEQQCQDTIIECARLAGYLVHHTRPARTTTGWRTALQGDTGAPDLTIVGHGRALFIELKRHPYAPTKGQERWLAEMRRAGLDARLVYVPEQQDALIAELIAGRT